MRVLVTGLGTFWGSHLAQQLEQIADVEMIVGLDTEPPRLPLERTEFVRADSNYSILDRIVRATAGRHDPAHAPHRRLHRAAGPGAARDQRDRHDEPARRRRRGRAARCARSS